MSRSSSRWDFHFHSYVLTIYVCLYCIFELVVFYSLVRRGYIRKVSVQLVHICFSRVCSTDSSSCSEQKIWKKTRLKQGRKTKEGNQNVVVVANSPDSSLLYCQTAIAPLSPQYRYAVTLLSLRCCNAIAPLLLRCRYASVAPLLHCCHTAITPVSLHCRSAAVAPAVDRQLHRYRTVVVPLLNRNCSSPERV